jgi:hypothetical protein
MRKYPYVFGYHKDSHLQVLVLGKHVYVFDVTAIIRRIHCTHSRNHYFLLPGDADEDPAPSQPLITGAVVMHHPDVDAATLRMMPA